MRRVFGVWLWGSLVSVSCSSTPPDAECAPGEERECGCPTSCSYQGCGACLQPAIAITATATCGADGRWQCPCGLEREPECEESAEPECEARCSLMLQSILRKKPADRSESDCRAAYQTLIECLGGVCTEPAPACTSEFLAVDTTCLADPPNACP